MLHSNSYRLWSVNAYCKDARDWGEPVTKGFSSKSLVAEVPAPAMHCPQLSRTRKANA